MPQAVAVILFLKALNQVYAQFTSPEGELLNSWVTVYLLCGMGQTDFQHKASLHVGVIRISSAESGQERDGTSVAVGGYVQKSCERERVCV